MDETLRAILMRIVVEPDVDLHRLVFADALEETGKPGDALWAEFIRVQIECSQWSEEAAMKELDADWKTKGKRERTLLTHMRNEIRTRIPSSQPDCFAWAFYRFAWAFYLRRHEDGTRDDYTASLDRGFLYQIVCGSEWFLRHADELIWHPYRNRPCPLTAQPIRRVVLTTWPDTENGFADQWWRFVGRTLWHGYRIENGKTFSPPTKSQMLEAEWPGVEFELPG